MRKEETVIKRLLLLVVAIVFVAVSGPVLPAQAQATVTAYVAGCDGFFASGTTNSPFIVIEVYDPAAGVDLFFGSFPAGAGGTFSIRLDFTSQPAGTILENWVWGSPTSDPEDWDGESYFFTEEPCTPRGPSFPVPAGFVMHTIICSVPVYNGPAGAPVGSNLVLDGQTWFVSPTPVLGADGAQWTEIFVGSAANPWIPTACVGGVAPPTP